MSLTKHTKVLLEPEVVSRLDALLDVTRFKERTLTRSDLMRQAIIEFLKREERKDASA